MKSVLNATGSLMKPVRKSPRYQRAVSISKSGRRNPKKSLLDIQIGQCGQRPHIEGVAYCR